MSSSRSRPRLDGLLGPGIDLLEINGGPAGVWGKIPRRKVGSFLPHRTVPEAQDPSVRFDGRPRWDLGAGVRLLFGHPLAAFLLHLAIAAGGAQFVRRLFTVLPLTLGTMQLETMVALKPSSRVSPVLELLGAVLSVNGGT
jgi:hypothetical protein